MQFSGSGQAAAFEQFIQQDDYLSENRGQYFERYGALAPLRGKWDLKFLQEYKLSDDNALQFSVDVLNLGNMINSDWGVRTLPQNVSPLSYKGKNAAGQPTFQYTNPDMKTTFINDNSLLSRWQMQLGVRYIFN